MQESWKCVDTQSRGHKPQLVCPHHYFYLLHSDGTILLYYIHTHNMHICVMLLKLLLNFLKVFISLIQVQKWSPIHSDFSVLQEELGMYV